MKIVMCDIWSFHGEGRYIAVTTNGSVRRDGCAVMGRGLAFQAARRFPYLARLLGERLRLSGNNVYIFESERIITFPVKHEWHMKADLELISKSARQLAELIKIHPEIAPVYMTKPGCGNGRRTWDEVRPIIEPVLADKVVITDFE